MTTTKFADRLAKLVESDGRTQREIAAAAGISQQNLSDLMRGTRDNPQVSTLARLGGVLGLSRTALGEMVYECFGEKGEK